MKTILRTVFGSRLYGTATPQSDVDIKEIFIPSGRDILLGTVKETDHVTHRPKGEGEKNYAGEEDIEAFSLKKYFRLLEEGQTVALDILFSNPENWIEFTWEWAEIVKNRHKLLTRKSEAFIGYCRQQAKKYGIKGSRVAAVRSSLNFLKGLQDLNGGLYKLGAFQDLIAKFVSTENNEFLNIVDQPQQSGTVVTFFEVCGRKMSYTATLKNAIDVLQFLFDEYGQRAKMAEDNTGVDWKACHHAVRVGQQAIELFDTGHVTFPRPNHEELLAIKLGQVPYKDVAEQIEDLFEKVDEAAKKSLLPAQVDREWIDSFIVDRYHYSVADDYYTRDLGL